MYPSSFPSLILLYCLSPPLPLRPYLPTLLLFLFYSLLFSPSSLFPLLLPLPQVDPPQTEEPPTTNSHRRNFWQGRAVEDYPPGVDSKFAPPAGTPSVCIRLKNMFETSGWVCVCVCGVCVCGRGCTGMGGCMLDELILHSFVAHLSSHAGTWMMNSLWR